MNGRLPESLHEPDLGELEHRLDVTFDSPALLLRALTHRSYAFEHSPMVPNERLEFLGDSVLGLVITDEIFHAHPDEQEGRLAKVRAAAVRTESLAVVARELGLAEFLRLGRGEAASGGGDKDSILADGLEAVLGAVYVDQGFDVAYRVVTALFGERLDHVGGVGAALDFKTSLQELAAASFNGLPHYQVVDSGPDHDKTFEAEVRVEGIVVGNGVGHSKKVAEQAAAKLAYASLTDRLAARAAESSSSGDPTDSVEQ
jgi:ribonuclease-3